MISFLLVLLSELARKLRMEASSLLMKVRRTDMNMEKSVAEAYLIASVGEGMEPAPS